MEIAPQGSRETASQLPLLIEEIQVGGAVVPFAGAAKLTLPSRPGSLAFTVPAAWWETGIFHATAVICAALLLGWLARMIELRRVRARMWRLEQEHALERERTHLARDLHDQVGASLTQIVLMADLATTPDCVSQLADSARKAVDSLDSIVWVADPVKDTLASLLQYLVRFAEDFLKPTGLRLRVDFSTDVPPRPLHPEFRHHVLLVVKEALNNAVKYSAGSEVHLGAVFSPETLAITIVDNGRGFEAGASVVDGNGLRNMRERAAVLGGECRVISAVGSGTRITLVVPWSSSGIVLQKRT
ncbi:MAG: ATP-binding protein [Chthoniobacteraceae bacterium]